MRTFSTTASAGTTTVSHRAFHKRNLLLSGQEHKISLSPAILNYSHATPKPQLSALLAQMANQPVYFSVFVFVLYLWIVHSGFCVVRYRTKTNTPKYTIHNVQSRDIERRQTHWSTQHRIQNVQSRVIERRQTHRSTQHRIQNVQSRGI
jgi:hypothetical protein